LIAIRLSQITNPLPLSLSKRFAARRFDKLSGSGLVRVGRLFQSQGNRV
jgi:hypothetical protein